MCAKIIDLTEKKFGKLTAIMRVVDHVSPKGVHQTQWLCRCECGNMRTVRAGELKSGRVTSCGCYRKGGNELNSGSKTKIWRSGDKWIVNVRVGTFNNLEEATAARDKANAMFSKGE